MNCDTPSLHYLSSTLKVFKYISSFSSVEVKIHILTVASIIAINTVVRDSGHSEICGLKRLIIPSLSLEHLKVAYNTTFVFKISTTSVSYTHLTLPTILRV